LIKCQNCKSQVPESPFCLKCGYPLYNMNQKGAIHNGSSVVPNTFPVREKAEIDEGRKKQLAKNSLKGAEYHVESSGMLGSEELLWIRMLKQSRISDDKIREIVTEWIMLVKKLKEVSNII
jgi:hypothetical protein